MQDRIRGGEGVVLRYRESRVFVKKSGLANEIDTISLPRDMGHRPNIASRKMLLGIAVPLYVVIWANNRNNINLKSFRYGVEKLFRRF